ncbi:HNH/ENDO VII family nuclease [Streptomyces hyderabadensis]|uniref:LHH domain-containing protein n=1 Tax=Streptomyces hyderabadensis TaxID=598549 RepID=A0ABP9HQY9_9ACTN
MKQGLAPMGPDGKPMNLHHMLQTQDGPIAEVTTRCTSGTLQRLEFTVLEGPSGRI